MYNRLKLSSSEQRYFLLYVDLTPGSSQSVIIHGFKTLISVKRTACWELFKFLALEISSLAGFLPPEGSYHKTPNHHHHPTEFREQDFGKSPDIEQFLFCFCSLAHSFTFVVLFSQFCIFFLIFSIIVLVAG